MMLSWVGEEMCFSVELFAVPPKQDGKANQHHKLQKQWLEILVSTAINTVLF